MRLRAFFSVTCRLQQIGPDIHAWPSTPCLNCSQPALLCFTQVCQPFQFLCPSSGPLHICVFIPEGSPPNTLNIPAYLTPLHPTFRSSGSLLSPNRLNKLGLSTHKTSFNYHPVSKNMCNCLCLLQCIFHKGTGLYLS